ncbi:MAG: tetratricopeptide repeat protein, partial [Acidobacteriota bacterium]|nr:tetratricopeptide repeat protein [Acidobacteriota bacterium]
MTKGNGLVGLKLERVTLFLLALACVGLAQQQQRPRTASPPNTGRTLAILTEPNAIVWLDEIRRGATDAGGKLMVLRVSPGAHTLRVRANGFKEVTMPVTAVQRGEIKVRLLRTTDEAELTFQQAETARETAKDEESRQKAVDLYRRTIQLRPAFPAAHVGLARVLLDLNDTNGALAEIEAARRDRRVYPEAS